jgi:hypothetical protein
MGSGDMKLLGVIASFALVLVGLSRPDSLESQSVPDVSPSPVEDGTTVEKLEIEAQQNPEPQIEKPLVPAPAAPLPEVVESTRPKPDEAPKNETIGPTIDSQVNADSAPEIETKVQNKLDAVRNITRQVAAKRLNIRESSSASSEVIGELKIGDKVHVLGLGPDGWVRVSTENDLLTGWVKGKFLNEPVSVSGSSTPEITIDSTGAGGSQFGPDPLGTDEGGLY